MKLNLRSKKKLKTEMRLVSGQEVYDIYGKLLEIKEWNSHSWDLFKNFDIRLQDSKVSAFGW